MAEGRSPILFVWMALTALAAVAGATALLAPASATASTLGIAGAMTLIFAVLILPLARGLDRFIRTWRSHVEAVARGASFDPPRPPRSVRSIVEPINRALMVLQRRGNELAVARDEAETRLTLERADRRILRAALDLVREGVVVTGAEDRVRHMNRSAAAMLGTDPRSARQRAIGEFGVPGLADLAARVTADDSLEQNVELPAADADGDRVFSITVTGLRDDHDEPEAKVTLLRDAASAPAGPDLSGEFVAHVTHELRTPLTSIRAYVEMLLDGDFRDEAARTSCYETILEETDRLARLIGNVLDLSRLEAGRVDIERRAVDIGTLVTRAAHIIGLQANAKQITLETSLPTCALVAQGDADMLYQVVLNLASNAVKYTRQGGHIVLAAHADPLARNIVVSVTDSGLGIPAADVPHLFDKFYRIKSHRRAADGTGIGLSLCKHIVESVHGGRIDVRSTNGVGSKFSFTIPAWVTGLRAAA